MNRPPEWPFWAPAAPAWAILMACLAGCGGAIQGASDRATQAAVDTIDTAKDKGELDDMASSAAGAARDELLDPAKVNPELAAIRDSFLPPLQLQLDGMRDDLLGARTTALGRVVVDGWLSTLDLHADSLRETLVGAPLQQDVHQLIAQEGPFLGETAGAAAAKAAAGAIGAVKVVVDTETSKVREDVEWGAVLLALGLLVYAVEAHRRALVKLLDRMEPK